MATDDAESFAWLPAGVTGLPTGQHVGAFGVVRTHHTHEGVDLYAEQGTPVRAVEPGEVVAVLPFTGPAAGLPWWLDTWAVLVEGATGVVCYGEILPQVSAGERVAAGQMLGAVTRVLRHDKGRPTCMLHLELHTPGTRECAAWPLEGPRPVSLRDPTPYLLPLSACNLAGSRP